MCPLDIVTTKKQLRDIYRLRRDEVTQETRINAGRRIIEALFFEKTLNLMERFNTFASFVSTPKEINTEFVGQALTAKNKVLCLPKWDEFQKRYIFCQLTPDNPLEVGPFNIWEPTNRTHFPSSDIEAVFVPGLAFDHLGNRLGYGGGNFDQLMARLRPSTLKIALCFDCQLSSTTLPTEPHDLRVDYIVTERHLVDCRLNLNQERMGKSWQMKH